VELLARLQRFTEFVVPVLAGLSRKKTIGELTGRDDPRERIFGSVAAHLVAAQRGATLLRVHDVAATVEALKVWAAVAAVPMPRIDAKPAIAWPDDLSGRLTAAAAFPGEAVRHDHWGAARNFGVLALALLAACDQSPSPEPPAPVAPVEAVANADPVEGLRVAKRVGCTGCHMDNGRGGGFDIKSPQGIAWWRRT
jgi:hypothetical protein